MSRGSTLRLRESYVLWILLRRSGSFFAILGLLLCFTPATQAQTTSSCAQWGFGSSSCSTGCVDNGTGTWFSSPDQAGAYKEQFCNTPGNQESCDNLRCTNVRIAAGGTCVFKYTGFVVKDSGWPYVQLNFTEHWSYPPTKKSGDLTRTFGTLTRTLAACQVYASAQQQPNAQCGPTCNGVGDPINPANASVYKAESDHSQGIAFSRFYNSVGGGGNLGSSWRHSFSRSIAPKYSGSTYKAYLSSASNSSKYNTEALACTSGFSQIKSQVSAWANASASYANGICSLSVGSTVIGTLPLYYTSPPTPAPGTPILIGLEATRDDGQVVSFKVQGGVISAPPSIAMRLQQTSSGYTLTDVNDNVEIYDVSGRLLSITSRAGVVQTMGYNAAGRLSTVTDSFGHGVTLAYDSQGRLSAVIKQ